jgi:hypothetical protein
MAKMYGGKKLKDSGLECSKMGEQMFTMKSKMVRPKYL